MKSLITSLILIFFSVVGVSQTDLDSILNTEKYNNIEYYPDTEIIHYVENININGKRNGKCYSFTREGQLLSKAEFKRGKKHGEWAVYNLEGKLMALFYYHKGSRFGHWKSFNEAGDVIAERLY